MLSISCLLVLATVLAQMLETSLQQSLLISQGSPLVFFTRPIALVFMILSALSLLRGAWVQLKQKGGVLIADDTD